MLSLTYLTNYIIFFKIKLCIASDASMQSFI